MALLCPTVFKEAGIFDYSGDLNDGNQLNNGNILTTNFYLSDIQMSSRQMVVRYSDHHFKTGPVFKWHSNTRPFSDRTTFDHLNSILVQYSDPCCTTNERKIYQFWFGT